MSAAPPHGREITAITFDFGNTLVPVGREALERVVDTLTDVAVVHLGVGRAAFREAWREERGRQFAEEIPRFREVEIGQRVVRVLARLRGFGPPPQGAAWDDCAAARLSAPGEVALALEAYSEAFVTGIPPGPEVGPLLARLALRYRLGILSNWPLAATIDRYVAAAGWAPWLRAVVVSERVGTIKPHPAIFRAAEAALADDPRVPLEPGSILHVGDDWAADIVGAKAAGWQVAYLCARPVDSPLPGSPVDATTAPDLMIDRLTDLEAALAALPTGTRVRP